MTYQGGLKVYKEAQNISFKEQPREQHKSTIINRCIPSNKSQRTVFSKFTNNEPPGSNIILFETDHSRIRMLAIQKEVTKKTLWRGEMTQDKQTRTEINLAGVSTLHF